MIEIPLNIDSEQTQHVVIDNIIYDITVIFNYRVSLWTMNIFIKDTDNGISCVPLSEGTNLLKQYNLPISNAYLINLDNNGNVTREGLGTIAKLFVLSQEELNSVTSL